MNKRYIVRLGAEEREQLDAIISKGSANARKIVHAQILLKVDEDGPQWADEQAAESFGVHAVTVKAIRERFVNEGLESALNRRKRETPPSPPKLDGAGEARLTAIACSQPPEGRARWTLKLLANRLVELEIVDSICRETVRQSLKKTS